MKRINNKSTATIVMKHLGMKKEESECLHRDQYLLFDNTHTVFTLFIDNQGYNILGYIVDNDTKYIVWDKEYNYHISIIETLCNIKPIIELFV